MNHGIVKKKVLVWIRTKLREMGRIKNAIVFICRRLELFWLFWEKMRTLGSFVALKNYRKNNNSQKAERDQWLSAKIST